MTELETMQRAKMYLDKLAQGTDPITGQPVPPGDSLSNPRLSRCFQYVSGVLEKVIQNGGQIGAPEKKSFTITSEQIESAQLNGEPLRLADFIDRLLRATNYEAIKTLSPNKLTNWLLKKGLLKQEQTPDGRTRRVPTPEGEKIGITARMCESQSGEYLGIFYDDNAQKFLLEHLPSIAAE